MREEGPLSRPDLAERLGVSAVTVANIARELVDAGFLREVGMARPRSRGRKALLLDVAPALGDVLAVDVRLSHVAWRRLNLSGDVVASGRFTVPDTPARLVRELVEAGGPLRGDPSTQSPPLHLAIAVPATVSPDGGVRYWGTPRFLHGCRLARMVEGAWPSVGVTVMNDINLAALAELRHGVGADWSRFVYIGVRATGIGMGLVLDGELYTGARGRAGEIGSLRMVPGEARLDGMFTNNSDEALSQLAQVLSVTFAVLDLDGVVLHSEIGRGFGWFEELARQLAALVPFQVPVVASRLGDEAVLHGAAVVALDAAWEGLVRLLDGAGVSPTGTERP